LDSLFFDFKDLLLGDVCNVRVEEGILGTFIAYAGTRYDLDCMDTLKALEGVLEGIGGVLRELRLVVPMGSRRLPPIVVDFTTVPAALCGVVGRVGGNDLESNEGWAACGSSGGAVGDVI
jgi:hypothetical protein